ncbi:elongation factor G [Clostridium sp. 'White wine YQ']|uniref:elongation factor G n=1 Tax=Clostridium sp. 'White wine YQ' TaxID=3027474 RepID=UPI0023674100|nr:elongation factor G [Clostridium sp. 'White wine YQ']MDD7796293.1 elongation factor G [Clostridium sp. 'White wine YQ']
MKEYKLANLRNVGIVGHGSSGKTSLVEALLFTTKLTDRLGKIEEGTTISDYDPEEKKRKISLSTSILPLEYKEKKINFLDTPGYFDFLGEQIEGMRASDVALIVVSGVSGVKVGTEKAWDYCNKIKLPRSFFINKLDRENADYDKVLASLKESFGMPVVPIQYPIGKEADFKGVVNVISRKAYIYDKGKVQEAGVPAELEERIEECRSMVMESVAETDEELLNKYFAEGELTDEEIYAGLIIGCTSGDIAPVMCGSALKNIGMEVLLDDICDCFPSPKYAVPQKAVKLDTGEEVFEEYNEDKPFSAFVFKSIADPFVGKLSLFRVITGKARGDLNIYNSSKDKTEKLSNLYFMRGKQQTPVKEIIAGDIGAVAKLQYTGTGDTLCEESFKIRYDNMNFPEPIMTMSVMPKSKGDEEKISVALTRLLEEDPTFNINRDTENAETIISGMGETHLDVIASKIKNKFGVDVLLQPPKIPYREAIKGIADVQGKHKKQSGGHGQYGDVWIKFEPRTDGETELEFIDKVVGGVVPRNFIPAVEKGLKECIQHGVLAGYPVIGLRATLHDGSYHSVDSSEMAFKVAASLAFKKGLEQAKAILLEPIMHVEVLVPEESMGDVIGDLNKRRGRVLGMEPDGNIQKLIAEVPLAEMFKYATDLRSITSARGNFSMKFERYEEVPPNEVDSIIEETKNLKNELVHA